MIALTQFLKLVKQGEYWSAGNIVAAAGLGALVGWLGVDGLTVADGIMGGLAAAGVVTTAGAIRPQSNELTVVENVETANVEAGAR